MRTCHRAAMSWFGMVSCGHGAMIGAAGPHDGADLSPTLARHQHRRASIIEALRRDSHTSHSGTALAVRLCQGIPWDAVIS